MAKSIRSIRRTQYNSCFIKKIAYHQWMDMIRKNKKQVTFAIYDTMQYIKPDVKTICTGMAASFGALLLLAGAKGKRYALPNSEIMIHQPLGGVKGQATEIEIAAKRILKLKEQINRIIAEKTGQKLKKVFSDTERDYFLSADEAKEYGIIDEIIISK